MKNKAILILLAIGMVITVVGAFFKIQHWQGATLVLIIGMAFEAVALISLILKILRKKDNSGGFLDS
jgi:uncharacterized membrane protein